MTYTVTQEDRDAAAAISNFGRRIKDLILSGEYDDHHFVQAFARHRIETLERAADVAAAYDCECEQAPDCSCWNSGVPAAIRALKGKSDE
jgi:hypothetical protein